MTGRYKALLVITAIVTATPVAAQSPGPATTAFDGTYAGVSTEVAKFASGGGARGRCQGMPTGVPAPLTIMNGVARTPGGEGWDGGVSPQGGLVMRSPNALRFDGQIDSQGTIRGQISGAGCAATLIWQKQSR